LLNLRRLTFLFWNVGKKILKTLSLSILKKPFENFSSILKKPFENFSSILKKPFENFNSILNKPFENFNSILKRESMIYGTLIFLFFTHDDWNCFSNVRWPCFTLTFRFTKHTNRKLFCSRSTRNSNWKDVSIVHPVLEKFSNILIAPEELTWACSNF
jgi:hypothetical protein